MKSAFLMVFILVCVSLSGNFVYQKPTEYTQPDGSKLSLFVTGDEYYRRVHDERDYTIVLDPQTGYAVYAVPENGDIRPSQHIAGRVDPASLGIAPRLFSSNPWPEQRYREQLRLSGENRVSPTGTINNIVCFVRFNDQSEFPATPTYTWYNNLFNSTTQQSLADYYDEVSSGQLDINTHIYRNNGGLVLSVQVDHDRGYYSPYNATTNPTGYQNNDQATLREWNLIIELCGLIDPLVPNTIDLDTDNDGINDALTFVIRGNVDDWGDILWPAHVWWSDNPSSINGVEVWHYVKDFEGGLGPSVVCHEMGHMIGFPDLYRYDNDWIEPVGQWSLMAHDNTQHELTYEKWKYGTWFATIPTITPSSTPTEYTLTAIDQSPYSCYKIASSNPDQFYMLEYRRDTGRYESGIPGSGLIVYRIIDNYAGGDVHGNAGAPPDEMYVYRPGGDIDTNGNWGNAHLSSTVGRTAIHNYTDPEPWLYVNSTTQVDGNLVITDVGASGGTTITFTVRNAAPNIWDGSTSTNWDTASNWSQNSVPTNTQYVEIPGGMPRYPVVSSSAPTCKYLTIKSGATVTIGNGTLNVMEDVDIFGTIAMNNDAGNFYIGDDLYFQSGSTANVTANAEFWIGGDLELLAGCNVNMSYGYMDFSGTSGSFIRCYQASAINHLRSHKTSSYLGVSSASTASLTINGNFWTYDTSNSYFYDSEPLIVKGSIYCYDTGVLQYGAGSVSMEGTSSSSIYFEGPGSYFNNLRVNKTGNSVILSTNVEINGSLTISSGTFNASSRTINLAGNWTNSVGPTAFTQSTSTVILDGSGTQTMTTDDFNILELNKSAGIMSIPSGVTVTCAIYNWTAGAYTVSGGVFTVSDLDDPGVMGSVTLNGGTINYTQDTGQYIDLRATITISSGTFNLNGGLGDCWFAYVDPATLNMSGGTLDIHDQGIYISNSYAFTDNVTAGTIRTVKSFSNHRADVNFSGGTLEFYGGTDASLINTAGSNLYNVLINKSSTREDDDRALVDYEIDRLGNRTPITRSNTITASGPLDINGSFTIQAGFFTAPAEINVAGNWANQVGPGAFNEGTGSVIFDGAGHQYCNYNENFNAITINKTGALRVNSSSATVTCASYTWVAGAVDVLLGTFTATDLTQSGIYGNFYVNPGATINLYQDNDQWTDLNGFFYLTGGGAINVTGGSGACFPAYMTDAGITMSGGEINFYTPGLSFVSRPTTLTLNITGGFLRTQGSFVDFRGGLIFSSGTVVLNGPGANTVGLGTGSRFYNLAIEKSGTRAAGITSTPQVFDAHGRTWTQDLRENSIMAGTNLQINGSLTVGQGIFDVNGMTINVFNDLAIWATLKMVFAGGFLDVDDDVLWQPTGVSNVSAGTIYCGGNWYFTNGCTVDLSGSLTRMNADYGANIENNSTTAKFGSLEIYGTEEEPDFYYVYSSPACQLLVQGNLRIYPENTLVMAGGSASVSGNLQIDQTGGLTESGSGIFTVNGDLLLYGNLSTGTGTVDVNGNFTNTANGFLTVAGGIFRNDAPWADPWIVTLNCGINVNNGTFQITNRSLNILAHASRVFNTAVLYVGAGFIAVPDNCYRPTAGSLNMIGGENPVLQVAGNNFITNLTIQKNSLSNSVVLQNNHTITGNINLLSGKLNANTHNMTVGGNWTVTTGSAQFAPGNGTVTFNKAGGSQVVSGTIDFYSVTDSHTGAALEFQGPTGIFGSIVTSNIVTFHNASLIGTLNNSASAAIVAFYGPYTSNVTNYTGGGALRSFSNSHVIVADLTQNGLYGSFIADTGHLEFHQDGSGWIDLNGPVNILNNGIIDIYGGSVSCDIAYNGNVTFTMGSGSFNVKNRGINIPNNGNSCSFNISGGTITTNGSFYEYRGNFNPTAGTLKFEGTADAVLHVSSSSYIYNLLVNKVVTREPLEPLTEIDKQGNQTRIDRTAILNVSPLSIYGGITVEAANIVSINGLCTMAGGGDIVVNDGVFRIYATNLITSGNIDIHDTLTLYAGSTLAIANNKSLSVWSGGTFESIANASNPSVVTRNGASGNYVFNVESGATIGAEYTTFEYISIYGVNVKTGALVDTGHAFTYCTFRNGPATSKLLTINNSQALIIDHANFPVIGSYNVSKTSNQGSVTLTNFTGDFSGAAYEWDPYNRITWDTGIVPEVTDFHIERQAPNNIRLWWTYPHPYTSFNIYACDTPGGTFVLAGTTTAMQWTGSSSNPRAFYKVTVVTP